MGQTMSSLAEVKLQKVTPTKQPIAMQPLVGGILSKRVNDLRRSGILLEPQLQNFTIDGDPNICRALVETGIEWARPFGNRLNVKTVVSPWTEAVKVIIASDHVVRTQEPVPEIDRTSIFLWELVNELARAAGVAVSRSQIDGKTTITMDFPVHNDNKEGVPSREMRLQMSDGPQLAKLNVIVFVQDQSIRMSAERALMAVDCKARFASNFLQLVRECELSLPQALVIESEMIDKDVSNLIAEIRRHSTTFASIEIVQTPNVFDIGLPGSGNPCRLSATSINANLADALRFELAQS